jgi:hypothetical protein
MSNIEIDALIKELNQKLLTIHHKVGTYPDYEIISLIKTIFEKISVSYSTYFEYIPQLLSIFEKCSNTSIAFLISIYFELYNAIIKTSHINEVKPTTFAITGEPDLEKLTKLFETNFKKNQGLRLSSDDINIDGFSKSDIEEMIGLSINAIQHFLENLDWDKIIIDTVMMQLVMLRRLLISIGDYHTIFFISANIVKHFSVSQHQQLSRNFSEEIIITSHNHNKVEYGYFNTFVAYSTNKAAIPGLVYAILSFTVALKKSSIDSLYIELIIKESIRFFRNIDMHKFSKDIYESIPSYIEYDEYEKRSLAHSYYAGLLMQQDPKLPTKLLDYLNEHREQIFANGVLDALPWLITLYNIKRVYTDADYSQSALGFYITTFEYIVPEENYKNYKIMFFGEISDLKKLLKDSLVRLDETSYVEDLKNDNHITIVIANRIIRISQNNFDFETLLLAAMVKADLSIIFNEKERIGLVQATINNIDDESFKKIYGDFSDTITLLEQNKKYNFAWILHSENKTFVLTLTDQKTYNEITTWDNRKFHRLVNKKYFSTLSFITTTKSRDEVRMVLPEEHLDESNQIKNEIIFSKINMEADTKSLLVVMDMDLAGFPHNLLIDHNEKFLYLERPICNIISTEWFVKYSGKTKFDASFSKAIWIPTVCGDWTISMLFSKLEDSLNKFSFQIDTAEVPVQPLSSDLNIIVSHGTNNIATIPALYPDENPRLDFSKYIGNGKVLIFFVCHSGSTQATPFSNSISSIVKDFILEGYSAVIAPFWSLSIDVAPIWLEEFLSQIHSGNDIITSVHEANMIVNEKYPTVAAWGCMHLYGDPDISLTQ